VITLLAVVPLMVLLVVVTQGRETASADVAGAASAPRVFRILLAGARPFAPLAPFEDFTDVATLSDGRIVALPGCCRRSLYEIDARGRARLLPVDTYFRLVEDNAVIEAPDGALLFSERGRVLRRAPDGMTTVLAGTPRARRASGDGGPAVGAGMEPTGLAPQADGSVLIADARNHRIRRVDTAGQITTVAGTGAPGSDGDGGPAVNARMTNPTAVSTFPDGSYLIAHGARQTLVRRVAADGTISTIAGGGPRRDLDGEPCPRSPVPATSLHFNAYAFGDIATLGDGGFIITSSAGVLMISAQGAASALMCGSGPLPRADGRDIYHAGRPLTAAFLAGYSAPEVAVGHDGSLVLDDGTMDGRLLLIATPGASRRLAVAITPATLGTVHRRQIVVASTMPATIELRVYRGRRHVAAITGQARAGETVFTLPRRLRAGIHDLRLLARTEDGRRATHSLRVLGTSTVPVRLARRLIRNYAGFHEIGEGQGIIRLQRCRHAGRRTVRCRLRVNANGSRYRATYSIRLRHDGVLTLIRRHRDAGPYTDGIELAAR
jgi:hypothetical protein